MCAASSAAVAADIPAATTTAVIGRWILLWVMSIFSQLCARGAPDLAALPAGAVNLYPRSVP